MLKRVIFEVVIFTFLHIFFVQMLTFFAHPIFANAVFLKKERIYAYFKISAGK